MSRKCWVWLLVFALALSGWQALAESGEFETQVIQTQEPCGTSTEDKTIIPVFIPEPEPEVDTERSPEPMPEAEHKTEAETEPEAEQEAEPQAEPETEAENEQEAEPEAEPNAGPEDEPEPEQGFESDAGGEPPLSGDPIPAGEVPEDHPAVEEPMLRQPDDAEQAPRPDLARILCFWQDRKVELCYVRDEQGSGWIAQPLPEPICAGVYVTNTGDCAVGPIVIRPDALNASDEGGMFSLSVKMEPCAENLYLESGESVLVATYIFSGQGGAIDCADAQTLCIGFSSGYAD